MSPKPNQKPPDYSFAIVFCLFGLFLTVMETPLYWHFQSSGQCGTGFDSILLKVVFSIFNLAFLGAGAALAWDQWRKSRMGRKHPGEPWLWDKEWQSGRLRHSNLSRTLVQTIWAAVLNVGIVVGLVSFGRNLLALPTKEKVLALIVCLGVAAVGAIQIAQAVWLWRRRVRYGDAIFEMDRVPGEIGGALSGTLTLPPRRRPPRTLRLVLNSIRYSNEHEKVIWQDSCPVSIAGGPDATRIQVYFLIPRECEATNEPEFLWRLELQESDSELEPIASFDVPIHY